MVEGDVIASNLSPYHFVPDFVHGDNKQLKAATKHAFEVNESMQSNLFHTRPAKNETNALSQLDLIGLFRCVCS